MIKFILTIFGIDYILNNIIQFCLVNTYLVNFITNNTLRLTDILYIQFLIIHIIFSKRKKRLDCCIRKCYGKNIVYEMIKSLHYSVTKFYNYADPVTLFDYLFFGFEILTMNENKHFLPYL